MKLICKHCGKELYGKGIYTKEKTAMWYAHLWESTYGCGRPEPMTEEDVIDRVLKKYNYEGLNRSLNQKNNMTVEKATCINCGRPIEYQNGMWYHPSRGFKINLCCSFRGGDLRSDAVAEPYSEDLVIDKVLNKYQKELEAR